MGVKVWSRLHGMQGFSRGGFETVRFRASAAVPHRALVLAHRAALRLDPLGRRSLTPSGRWRCVLCSQRSTADAWWSIK